MGYMSSNPTKEKKKLFNFLEKQEYPSKRKVIEYAKEHNLKIESRGSNWQTVLSKKGTPIAAIHGKKKVITNWMVR